MSRPDDTAGTGEPINPYCAHHGKRWSEHEGGRCLYCSLCFKTLTPDECAYLPDGSKHDTCVACAEAEEARLVAAVREAEARAETLERAIEYAHAARGNAEARAERAERALRERTGAVAYGPSDGTTPLAAVSGEAPNDE